MKAFLLLWLCGAALSADEVVPADPAQALAHFNERLRQNPGDAQALAGRAAVLASQGDKASACADATAAAQLAPDDDKIARVAAMACHQQVLQGKEYKAKPKKELEKEDDIAERKKLEARDKPKKPEPAPAAPAPPPQTARPATAADPNAPFESYERTKQAQAILYSGKAVEGIALLQDALRLDPNNVRARASLAAAYDTQGDFAAALASAEEGLKRRPGHGDLLRVKAHAQLKLKDLDGAKAAADELLAQNPTDALAYALKAQAAGLSGDRDGMLDLLEKAAAFDPAFGAALGEARGAPLDADPPFHLPGERRSSPRQPKKDKAVETVVQRLMIALTAFALIGFALYLVRSRSEENEPAPEPPPEPPAEEQPKS